MRFSLILFIEILKRVIFFSKNISHQKFSDFGYSAPEYAIRGKLTPKADIYSFGVLLLEIVSGKCNTNKRSPAEEQNLLERAWTLYEREMLIQLVDGALEGDFDTNDPCRFMKIYYYYY
ncbi:probable LRR receptor-like serine/threonine-protein kinase at1g29720 [Phtheirospermum japonicum]|uniref:Probable LRR receptor-like serine/threonine-protein kinase at1g29720 n=1 Tax=Phtheirospermum japonicum TaxID=374723 RepID=A0A830CD70_9LAMI|nr:probable LRR receptor-like serine/threonine-protein kinase at1g29720 [Phtheirospermum japonicum]